MAEDHSINVLLSRQQVGRHWFAGLTYMVNMA
jgi:hypothetical protein